MRCDQHIGLPPEAVDFLANQELMPDLCPHCGRPLETTQLVIGHYRGMFDQEYDLVRHPLTNGYADEFLQAVPWSSGPMFFLGLKVYKRSGKLERVIQWSKEELREAE